MAHVSLSFLTDDLGFGRLILDPEVAPGGWRMGIRAMFYILCGSCGYRLGDYAASEQDLKIAHQDNMLCPECGTPLCFEEQDWPK